MGFCAVLCCAHMTTHNHFKSTDPGYDACVAATRKSLVTATAATAAMSSFLMGSVANVPFAIMPGMGVNA